MSSPSDRPPGPSDGMPTSLPTGAKPGRPGEPLPKGAIPLDKLPAGGLPPLPMGKSSPGMGRIRFKEMPKMNARPYVKRAIHLLGQHKRYVAISLFVSLIIFLLPFVAAAALGPLIKLFGDAARGGDWSKVWSLTGSFYDKTAHGIP
ncbi:MAG: hypothetical protein M3362_20955, partial [Acidobacteriota bacterium]|nr:hypothetical protein [Acidobacteriota bacterium]